MNKQTWDILTEVLEHEPEHRIEKLKELCKGSEELLKELTRLVSEGESIDDWWNTNAEYNDIFLFNASKEITQQFPKIEDIIGQTFGAYTIIDKIASGGMGNVFLAKRSDGAFDREVAIKVMSFNLNPTTIKQRFLKEQKILASLNHPGIAQLYDANISENGIPYLVMEYVAGKSLMDYALEEKRRFDAKIELFIKICEAVEYAHRNLVIHRDLKPSNILVSTEGTPKILDFGISELLREISEEEESKAYTLKYSSPEQIKGDRLTTSSDVYSLGILLFELLTGEHPLNISKLDRRQAEGHALESKISEPSSVSNNKNLKGDLDAIVLKATHIDAKLRYQTAQDLADDLHRYKNKEPVDAKNTGVIERGLKFFKRNPVSSSLGLVLILGSILFSLFYNIQITKERDLARLEAEKATVTKEYLLDLFSIADPLNKPGEKQTVEELLKVNIQSLSALNNQLEVKEDAAYTLAQVSFNLGAYFQAESLFVESYKINKDRNTGTTIEQGNALDKIGIIYVQLADYNEAKTYFDSALTIKRELLDPNNEGIAASYSMIGGTLAHLGNLDSAEVLLAKSMAIYSKNTTLDPKFLISNIESVADLSRERKDFERSARLLEENILLRKKYLQEDKRGLALSFNNLGFSYRSLENFEKAEEAYTSSLDILEEVFGEAHPNTITTLSNLAGIYNLMGNRTLAEETLSIRLERVKTAFGEPHWRVGQAYAGLGGFFYNTDQYLKSMESYENSILIYEKTLGKDHFWTNRAKLNYAISQALSGNVKVEEQSFEVALNEIKRNIESRLTYYNYSSLEQMQENLTKHDELKELAKTLSDFIEWHNTKFPI